MEDSPEKGGLERSSLASEEKKKFKKCPDCNGRGFFRERLDRTHPTFILRTCKRCGRTGKIPVE